ncbi:MAG: PIN domain-containing protein [Thermodesulfobacteriota bacterium]|nr:PIN domain-containing protein [Thermodesulfobacteriota bacterium]
MKGRIFVDTNILIYAHDLDAGPRHDIAASAVEELWESENGVMSTQVLQEFYVNVTRKISKPLSQAHARGIIENYLAWHIEVNEPDTVLMASEIEERHLLSFWDALILAAASRARVDKILTEDLNHGQKIEGILIENPFTI